MYHASITEARNGFSSLLKHVRRGEIVLITDRGKPVARLEPCLASEDPRIARLEAEGVLSSPREKLDLEGLLKVPLPRLPDGVRASDAVTEDREEGW
jgi:prevent-host-death family protein